MKDKTKTVEQESQAEEDDSYLKYIMKHNNINITVEDGGTVIFQSGRPKDPKPGNP